MVQLGDTATCKQELKRSGGKYGSYAQKGDVLKVYSITYYPVLLVVNQRTGDQFSMREEKFLELL
jgi:hypothetical protein